MLPENTRAYTITALNAPYTIPEGINSNPHALYSAHEQAGLILPGEIGGFWYGTYALGQGVSEEGTGAHFMLSTDCDYFVSIHNSSVDQLAPGIQATLNFLKANSSRAVAGLHHSSEPRFVDGLNRERNTAARQAKGNTQIQQWNMIHIHCVDPGENITALSEAPKNVFDFGSRFVERLLYKLCLAEPLVPNNAPIPIEGRSVGDYFPHGGVLYQFDPSTPAYEITELIKNFDTKYYQWHHEIFGLFAENYEQVQQSGWTIPYEIKPIHQIAQEIQQSTLLDSKTKQVLIKFAPRLLQENAITDPNSLLYRSPSYAITFFKDHASNYVLMGGNILNRVGMTERVGINIIKRYEPGTSQEQRKIRANEAFRKIILPE